MAIFFSLVRVLVMTNVGCITAHLVSTVAVILHMAEY